MQSQVAEAIWDQTNDRGIIWEQEGQTREAGSKFGPHTVTVSPPAMNIEKQMELNFAEPKQCSHIQPIHTSWDQIQDRTDLKIIF